MVTTRKSKKGKEKQVSEEVSSQNKKRSFASVNEESNSVITSEKIENSASKRQKGKKKADISVDTEEILSESDEEEDDIDWETIQLPPRFSEEDKVTYDDVEIVMEAPRVSLKKSHWEMAYQRNLRDWIHNSHVLLLIAHFKIRNFWCSKNEIMSVCSSIIPEHAKSLLSNESTSEKNLIMGIKWLLKWWSDYFNVTGPGLLTRSSTYFSHLKNVTTIMGKKESNEEADYIENFTSFLEMFSSRSGTRDTSVELFVALLRSCGCETRLVCSLQPVSYKPPNPIKKEITVDEDTMEEETPSVTFEFRAPNKPYVDPNELWKDPKAKPPTVWAEVFCKESGKWICVDPIRGHVNKPKLMEPAQLDRNNRISYILAFEKTDSKGKGNIIDITQRYTSNMGKAMKERERPLSKREKEGGLKLWSQVFLDNLCKHNRLTEKDILEQEELQQNHPDQVMPTSITAFKNHPIYVLERHLKKHEILYQKEPVLGFIKNEKIYPRQCVRNVSTADAFRKAGREVIKGEQPLKMIKAHASTIHTKRLQERAKQEGEDLLVACYGEWQTQLYIPPPIANGKIVKNAYGNIDLFKPTMLPKGAAHIPIKGIAKMAKKFGIDYADAVVDFEFTKMKAVPVINGIVIAEESKQILLEAWEEYDQSMVMKAIEKQEKESLLRWRKLIKGLMIKARVDNEYGKQDVWAGYKDTEEGGGFLPEE